MKYTCIEHIPSNPGCLIIQVTVSSLTYPFFFTGWNNLAVFIVTSYIFNNVTIVIFGFTHLAISKKPSLHPFLQQNYCVKNLEL